MRLCGGCRGLPGRKRELSTSSTPRRSVMEEHPGLSSGGFPHGSTARVEKPTSSTGGVNLHEGQPREGPAQSVQRRKPKGRHGLNESAGRMACDAHSRLGKKPTRFVSARPGAAPRHESESRIRHSSGGDTPEWFRCPAWSSREVLVPGSLLPSKVRFVRAHVRSGLK